MWGSDRPEVPPRSPPADGLRSMAPCPGIPTASEVANCDAAWPCCLTSGRTRPARLVSAAVRRRSIGAALAVTVVVCGVALIGCVGDVGQAADTGAGRSPRTSTPAAASSPLGTPRRSTTPMGSALSSVMVGMAVDPASTVAKPGLLAGWPPTAGCSPRGAPRFYGSLGRPPAQRARRGHGVHTGWQWLLVGSAGRRGLLLRQRQLLRLDGRHPAQQAGGRHGVHGRRQGLLVGGGRRRHLLLR